MFKIDFLIGSQIFLFVLQEQDLKKLKEFIADKKPHVVAVTAESRLIL